MMILAMSDKRVERLRQAISAAYGAETFSPPIRPRPDVQEMYVAARRQLLCYVRCLLEEWPDRFIDLSQRHKVWSSVWLRHLGADPRGRERAAPFWFWSVVHDCLYRARYHPSEDEVREAISYLKRKGEVPNKLKLARLLGVAVLRRGII
jgi:hypothetical protein